MMGALSVINGSTSRMILWITGIVIIIIACGMVWLAIESKPIPAELTTVMSSLIFFIIGSRVSPPDVTQQILDTHASDGKGSPPHVAP